MEGRFSSPVFPGESLTVNMWVDGDAAVFIYYGSPAGLGTDDYEPFSLALPAATYGDGAYALGAAGDVNGDGYDDFAVGAPWFQSAGYPTDAGAVFLFTGFPR